MAATVRIISSDDPTLFAALFAINRHLPDDVTLSPSLTSFEHEIRECIQSFRKEIETFARIIETENRTEIEDLYTLFLKYQIETDQRMADLENGARCHRCDSK